jgi:hypothetical protein
MVRRKHPQCKRVGILSSQARRPLRLLEVKIAFPVSHNVLIKAEEYVK